MDGAPNSRSPAVNVSSNRCEYGYTVLQTLQERNREPNFLLRYTRRRLHCEVQTLCAADSFEIRELVHKACPAVVETMKWSRPFFEYKGAIVGNMSAFNEHCSWGFWGEEISAVLREMDL